MKTLRGPLFACFWAAAVQGLRRNKDMKRAQVSTTRCIHGTRHKLICSSRTRKRRRCNLRCNTKGESFISPPHPAHRSLLHLTPCVLQTLVAHQQQKAQDRKICCVNMVPEVVPATRAPANQSALKLLSHSAPTCSFKRVWDSQRRLKHAISSKFNRI